VLITGNLDTGCIRTAAMQWESTWLGWVQVTVKLESGGESCQATPCCSPPPPPDAKVDLVQPPEIAVVAPTPPMQATAKSGNQVGVIDPVGDVVTTVSSRWVDTSPLDPMNGTSRNPICALEVPE